MSQATPKETDIIIKEAARLISAAINIAVHNDMPINEMDEYVMG